MTKSFLYQAFSPAKLNLFLHITGKLPDGYHALQTVFCALDFGDTLDFFVNSDPNASLIKLVGADNLTKTVDDNLIVKAGHALAQFARQTGCGTPFPIDIHLTKRIPTGAGLGGGSSNAGTTLLTLNRLWQLNLETDTLLGLAKSLGADVPFFVLAPKYSTCIGEGIGERLSPIILPNCRYLLLFPDVHNNTKILFADPNLNKSHPILSHETLIQQQSQYAYQLNAPFCNVFESIVKQEPSIAKAFAYLEKMALGTGSTPRLTGTGSTVFLPIPYDMDKAQVQSWLTNAPCRGVVGEHWQES